MTDKFLYQRSKYLIEHSSVGGGWKLEAEDDEMAFLPCPDHRTRDMTEWEVKDFQQSQMTIIGSNHQALE